MYKNPIETFDSKICYLDIETTGFSPIRDEITLIGIYDNFGNSNFFINGKNLKDVIEKLEEYEIIVTFNGTSFDIPFIEKKLNIKINHQHIDLRYCLKEIGLTGGLKKIEKILNIQREEEICEMTGYEAVLLWKRYKKGDLDSLRKLIKYNYEDIKNLKYLLEFYNKSKN